MKGVAVILSGPSGVGKDTVIEAWTRRDPRVRRVVAYTTRPPRPGEQDGVDYHFVAPERFTELAQGGHFLEHKLVHGHAYATPLADLRRMLDEGHVAVLKIDVQGALTAMERLPEARSVFLLPPSSQELRRRIEGRAQDSPEQIARRLDAAQDEMAQSDRYAHRVVNDEVERVVDALQEIVRG